VPIELCSLGVTAEALRANIDWKSAFLKQVDQFGPKFQVEGDSHYQPFLHADIIYRKKLCSRLASSEVHF